MLLDAQSVFSGAVSLDGQRTAQAITATALSTNVVELVPIGVPALYDTDFSVPMFVVVQVLQAFNNLTSLRIGIEHDSSPTMVVTPVEVAALVVPLAALTAGAIVMRMPLPSTDYKRYLALRYTVTGTNPTLGSLFAHLTSSPARSLQYRSAVALDV